jgi:predicted amidohydrolase YtcJ
LILTDAIVRTMDPGRPLAEAVAAAGGRIIYVGDARGAERYRGPSTEVVDLDGRLVLPAFQDSHVHLVTGGVELEQCDLNDAAAPEEVFRRIRDYAAAHPGQAWIEGGGWALPLFPQANPTKEDLDRLVPDRPVCLSSADGHSSWVNSRALALARITKDTPDPPGGRIERDARTGEPSGTLREAAAGLVERLIPAPTPEALQDGLRRGVALAHRFGITSIIEASADERLLEAYAALDRRGELGLRVLASLHVDPDKGTAQIARLSALREKYRAGHLRADAAKIFADGVLESGTAALLEPYLNRPGDRGRPNLAPEVFDALAVALDRAGFQIHIHAIGDRGVRLSLDALEAARRANGDRDLRHHIAHLEFIDPADIPRFRTLRVVANFQALWAYPDAYITDLVAPSLGPARSRWLRPIGSVARTGATLAGGSDWSVSSLNPLDAIEVAVTRRGPDDPPGEPWIPEELTDLRTMIAAYTTNGAYLAREERSRGSIAVGKAADLVVLDRDPFTVPAAEINQARVLWTFFEGRAVYRAAASGTNRPSP